MVVNSTGALNRFYAAFAGTLRRVPGGFARTICPQWPRSDVQVVPPCIPTSADTDGDGISDIRILNRVRLIDGDENGVIEREGADYVVIHVAEAAPMREDVQLAIDDDTVAEAAIQVSARI